MFVNFKPYLANLIYMLFIHMFHRGNPFEVILTHQSGEADLASSGECCVPEHAI